MAVLPTKHRTPKTRVLGSPREGLWVPEPDMGHCTVHLHWATRVGDSRSPCWPRICEPLQKPGELRFWVPELSEEGNCQAQGPRQGGVTVDVQGGTPHCRPPTPVPHALRPVWLGLRPRFSRVVTRKARGPFFPTPALHIPGWAGQEPADPARSFLLLTDTQPKKVRKVPPGLPSSVSCGQSGVLQAKCPGSRGPLCWPYTACRGGGGTGLCVTSALQPSQ